jgi:hypothetical protein
MISKFLLDCTVMTVLPELVELEEDDDVPELLAAAEPDPPLLLPPEPEADAEPEPLPEPEPEDDPEPEADEEPELTVLVEPVTFCPTA